MAKTALGDLQHAIMRILWERGEVSVTDVHTELLPKRNLAFTTVATMLRKMEQKGVIAHRSLGRRFLYRATVTRSEVRRSMVGQLIDRLFDGDTTALVMHLVDGHDIDPEELSSIAAELTEAEKREKREND